jgi:hypothetical protein
MIRASRIFALTLSLVLPACTPSPQSEIDRLADRLERGPTGLACFTSSWARKQDFDQPKPSILDGAKIHLDPRTASWKKSDDAVLASARATYAGYLWEFSVTEFGSSHYYSSDRYHCSKAAIPIGRKPPPLGQMTDEGTAMDGKFRKIETPFR